MDRSGVAGGAAAGGNPYGTLELPSLHLHYPPPPPHSLSHPPMHESFPPDDDAASADDIVGIGGRKGSSPSAWHRVKWTGGMVKLLVTSAAYIDEDVGGADEGSGTAVKRRHLMLKRRGKWKLISDAMARRGYRVSPQQCEDKFNDLNKRYKRLTDILGRGTACDVVENPKLLDQMTGLSDKLREDARRILSSKHLHYEEMCSYHNGNFACLLDDPELRQSLRLALRGRNPGEAAFSDSDSGDDDDHPQLQPQLQKQSNAGTSMVTGEGLAVPPVLPGEVAVVRLEEERVRIQGEALELEKERFKWERFSKKKERELQRMKMENEQRMLENERMRLQIRMKELEMEMARGKGGSGGRVVPAPAAPAR